MVEEFISIICLGCGSEELITYDPHSRSQRYCYTCKELDIINIPFDDEKEERVLVPFL